MTLMSLTQACKYQIHDLCISCRVLMKVQMRKTSVGLKEIEFMSFDPYISPSLKTK